MPARFLSLERATVPEDMPEWITQEYLESCAKNESLQKSWSPVRGDWFYCQDLLSVIQIKTKKGYLFADGVGGYTVKNGRWNCDVYLPKPIVLDSD